jgi:hypothetical protein
MMSVFGSIYHCEQLFSLMKTVTKIHLTDERTLGGSMQIATAKIKPGTERLLKENLTND